MTLLDFTDHAVRTFLVMFIFFGSAQLLQRFADARSSE